MSLTMVCMMVSYKVESYIKSEFRHQVKVNESQTEVL